MTYNGDPRMGKLTFYKPENVKSVPSHELPTHPPPSPILGQTIDRRMMPSSSTNLFPV